MTKPKVRTRKRVITPNTFADNSHAASSGGALHSNLRLQTHYRAPGELKPPARILRKHSAKQLKLMEASISEHGFNNPILVDGDGQIISGHARWLAATALGMSLVPVIELEHLSPEQLRLYAIADNKIAEQSEFDFAELKIELGELEDLNLDLKLELSGFATSEIDDLLCVKVTDSEEGDAEDAAPREGAIAITRVGDVWALGEHRLICGNSLEGETYVTVMDGAKAAMVFGDPPYNLSASAISGKGKHKHRDFAMAAGEMSEAEFTSFLTTVFDHLVKNSGDGALHFQCIDWGHMGEMLAAGRAAYSELKNLIVWAKPSAGMGTCYRSQHELIFLWKSGTAPHINNFGLGETGRHRSNVWNYKGNAGFHRGRDEELAAHPTVKPWGMVADAIRDCSKRGDIILDPFGGYGTTLIAAERTGRKARLIELDPLYCDATIQRWQGLTGKDAVLVASGQTFEETREERTATAGEDNGLPDGSDGGDGEDDIGGVEENTEGGDA